MLCALEKDKGECSKGLAAAKAELQRISRRATDLYAEAAPVVGCRRAFSASVQLERLKRERNSVLTQVSAASPKSYSHFCPPCRATP